MAVSADARVWSKGHRGGGGDFSPFLSALLRYDCNTFLYEFKVYNIMTYMLQNDCHNNLVNIHHLID